LRTQAINRIIDQGDLVHEAVCTKIQLVLGLYAIWEIIAERQLTTIGQCDDQVVAFTGII
jgi:hypothetical protein